MGFQVDVESMENAVEMGPGRLLAIMKEKNEYVKSKNCIWVYVPGLVCYG